MKAKNLVKMAVAAFLISGMSASNAMAASTTGQAEALVVTPITIALSNTALSFGGIVAQAAAGAVAVDTAGAASSATHTLVVPTTASAANFAVAGDPNRTYTATVDTTVNLVDGAAVGTDMVATLFSANAGVLDGTGNDNINVSGSLAVGANQVAGSYAGTFNVSVNY